MDTDMLIIEDRNPSSEMEIVDDMNRDFQRRRQSDATISMGSNIDQNVEKSHPIRIAQCNCYGISPFGVYCFECHTPIGTTGTCISPGLIRKHNKRKNHYKNIVQGPTETANLLIEAMDRHYGNIRNFDRWIMEKDIKLFCCSCGVTSNKKYNLQRHIDMSKKKTGIMDQASHVLVDCIMCVQTTCGRNVENRRLLDMMNKPHVNSVTCNRNPSVQLPTEVNLDSNILENFYIPLKSDNRKWITTKSDDVLRIFNEFKKVDETLEPYLSSLKLLMISCKGCVVKQIRHDLSMMEDSVVIETDPDDSEGSNDREYNHQNNGDDFGGNDVLMYFLESLVQWVRVYCREHVNILDGKIRHKLQSFFDESVTSLSGHKINFSMREKEDVIIKELKILVRMIWRLCCKGEIRDELKSLLVPIMKRIMDMHTEYNGMVSKISVEQMVTELIIQKFLHFTFIESKRNAYILLLGHRIVMSRLFYIKKVRTSEDNEKKMCIRNCSEFGSIIGLHLHIYRLATASLISCTESDSWDHILTSVSNSSLCHTLSPIITKVKHMNNNKIEVRTKRIKDNGDISIDDFDFPKSKWSRLIPRLLVLMNETLGDIIGNLSWKDIVDLRNQINVYRMTGDGVDKEDLMHYKFNINLNGKIVDENDIIFRGGILDSTFERLTGLVMISLHGLGLGSTRISELFRLMQHQTSWRNGTLYYITSSNKRRSMVVSNKKVVTHKLPASISRYLLIYDRIGMTFNKGRETFLFMHKPENVEMNLGMNKMFFSEFASIFELPSNCTCLIMRHLYTCICNYLFPANNNNFDKSIVSTVACIAEMSGHSAETHEQYYSSTIDKETFFNKYHQNLGEDVTIDSEVNEPLNFATEDDILNCLRVLLGVKANYLSTLQRDMVLDACNNRTKHSFCTIGCGGGKSLSWIIPAMRESLKSIRPKLSIIVIPYCFLLDHHVTSTIGFVGQCSSLVVKKLKGRDIYDNLCPELLRDKGSLPALLYLSLEAISLLVRYHYSYLEELQKDGLLHKIYFDECHTLLSELNFRLNFHSLAKLAGLNVPMMVLSGSFQQCFVRNFLYFMFGSEDLSEYNLFIDKKILGNTLLKIGHFPSTDYVDDCCTNVMKYLEDNCTTNVHVIVATIDEGTKVYEKIKKSYSGSCAFIYSGSKDQDVIAQKWKENDIRVLISTTLGLVGNESINTQLVCIVGLLYNIPSIVQSMGRIRPMRRTKHSSVLIFTGRNYSSQLKCAEENSWKAYDELVGCNLVSKSMERDYFRSMSQLSVNNWLFNDTGCRLVSLAKRLGYQQKKCNLCDVCTNTHVKKASICKTIQSNQSNQQKNNGIRLLQRLKQKCICCNLSTCIGNCVVRGLGKGLICYHCLGRHASKNCTVYRPILNGKACFTCYRFNYNQQCIHRYSDCAKDGEVKERLRALIQNDFLEKQKNGSKSLSFISHLAGIYASEETYFRFLHKYKDWK